MAHAFMVRRDPVAQRALLPLFLLVLIAEFMSCASSSPRYGAAKGSQRNDSLQVSAVSGDSVIVTSKNDPVALSAERETNPATDRHQMLEAIMALMETPYSYDGSDSTGMDCSGLTSKIYADVLGRIIPHSCKAQFGAGHRVGREGLKFGDLVFFDTGNESPSHVGIYVGDGLFAHASSSIGVTISLLGDPYYEKRYAGARRIVSP